LPQGCDNPAALANGAGAPHNRPLKPDDHRAGRDRSLRTPNPGVDRHVPRDRFHGCSGDIDLHLSGAREAREHRFALDGVAALNFWSDGRDGERLDAAVGARTEPNRGEPAEDRAIERAGRLKKLKEQLLFG
jgi:hypothetical protein